MIRQLFNIILFSAFLIHPTIGYSQINRNIIISGNSNFSDDFYISEIASLKDESKIKKKIFTALADQGYFFPTIENIDIDSTSNSLSVILKEGKRTYIHSVLVDSLSKNDSIFVLPEIEKLIGEPLISAEVERVIQKIIYYYENTGYPFVEIKINSILFKEDSLQNSIANIHLVFLKNQASNIDIIKVIGNEKTNDSVIKNAARIYEGMSYSQKNIDEIQPQLEKLRFFKKVDKPVFFLMENNKGVLQINVEEKNTNSFDGIIGYVPSQNNSDSYLTGFVNVNLRNLFGTGRAFAIKWERETAETQELELKYLEPWVFNYPIAMQINLFQRQQDSSFVKRIIGAELKYLATNNISASLLFEYESVIPSTNAGTISVLNSNSLNSGLEFVLDYRDDIFSPTSGLLFSSKYIFRSKTVKDYNSVQGINSNNLEYHNYELKFGIYKSFFVNQVVALELNAKEIVGTYFDESDYLYFGGTNSLRGYREKQFLANRLAWGNLEYRFLLSQLSYLFGFYDYGYYLMESKVLNIGNVSSTLSGFGVGINLETGLGILKVSYAVPKGGSISSGLIHFGLVNEF